MACIVLQQICCLTSCYQTIMLLPCQALLILSIPRSAHLHPQKTTSHLGAGREGLCFDQRPDRPFGLSSRLPICILCLVPNDSKRQHHASSNHLRLHLPRKSSCCHATVHHFTCCASLGTNSTVSVQACEVHLSLAHVQ